MVEKPSTQHEPLRPLRALQAVPDNIAQGYFRIVVVDIRTGRRGKELLPVGRVMSCRIMNKQAFKPVVPMGDFEAEDGREFSVHGIYEMPGGACWFLTVIDGERVMCQIIHLRPKGEEAHRLVAELGASALTDAEPEPASVDEFPQGRGGIWQAVAKVFGQGRLWGREKKK